MNNKKHSKGKSSNAFYIVLSLCLIAVGVAAWSAVSAFNDFSKTPEPEPQLPQISVPEQPTEQPTDSELPKVEYEKEPTDSDNKTATDEPVADYFLMPIDNGKISKNFDDKTLQYSATFGDMRLHSAVDILAAVGAEVKSAGRGKVSEVYFDAALGNIVVIDHGNGIIAKYCGLNDDILVSVGDTTEAGTPLGTLGTVPSEMSDEAHLHLEMLKNGVAASPLEIMKME